MRERTILFVDDEAKCRKYFQRLFQERFDIMLAADGREALTIFERCRGEIGTVVTDQIMPRVTGLDLLREVGRAGPEVVRILSTAYANSDLVAQAARDGVIDFFIVKPWEIERVEATLEQAAAQFALHGRGTGTR